MERFNILSLSGGGVRGIFQATVLSRIAEELEGDLASKFNLIAGTSTGAIQAIALAAGVSPDELPPIYRKHGPAIFSPSRRWGPVRRGPRFSQDTLRSVLLTKVGNRTLEKLEVPVLLPAANIDRFEGKVFSSHTDADVLAVEAALASAAAPTYFAPVRPTTMERAFVDGGVWANDPSYVAVEYAISELGVDRADIRLLSIGTGRVPKGKPPHEVERIRPASLETIKYLSDIVSSTQSWEAAQLCENKLLPGCEVRIDPILTSWISLDDYSEANSILPPLAERAVEETIRDVERLLESGEEGATPIPTDCEAELEIVRRAIDSVTSVNVAEFREDSSTIFVMGYAPNQDRIEARITTTPFDDEIWETLGALEAENRPVRPMRWQRVRVVSDTAPPESLTEMHWQARSAEGNALEVVPILRSEIDAEAVVFFDREVLPGEEYAWTYSLRWPGFFDTFRKTGRDMVSCDVGRATRHFALTIEYPAGLRLTGHYLSGDKNLPGRAPAEISAESGNRPSITHSAEMPVEGTTFGIEILQAD